MPEIKQDIRTATLVVAANDSLYKNMADYTCDGVNDHLEIQAALDALPATGGEVSLLDGTFHIEDNLVLDSNQTLRGCGRNTILRTTTEDVYIITATGSADNRKVGILIADLRVIGDLVAENDYGIWFYYVDYSTIENVFVEDNYDGAGISLSYCDHNTITGNFCKDNGGNGIHLSHSHHNTVIGNTSQFNGSSGIYLSTSHHNTVIENTSQFNGSSGIYLSSSHHNTVIGNTCWGNTVGLSLAGADDNTITGNSCWANLRDGIYLSSSHSNTVIGNHCSTNSQMADNTYDNIFVEDSDYNLIANEVCRAPTIGTTLTVGEPIGETEIAVTDTTGFTVGMGVVIDLGGGNEEYHIISAIAGFAPGVITIDAGLTNNQALGETIDVPEARYGINISADTCNKNIVQGNDLHDAGKTANLNDVGTLTIVESNNREIEITQIKIYRNVKNASGGALAAGDVVILEAVAAGNEVTTTTTCGDDNVYGMVAEAIADTAYGYVQVKGKTTALKCSNDKGNIAIGDLLVASDTAKEAVLAAGGQMAFARALATQDAAGPTAKDAYIKSPWD